MSAQVTVSLDGQRRSVPRGTTVSEVLDGARGREVVAARLNGKLVDLSRPIEDDATIEPVKTDSPEGLDVLRHSTAHLMAQAVQSLYPGTQVTIGPTIEDGFFYDFAPPTPFTVDDLPKIEAKMRELAKANLKVERIEVARAEAIERFAAMGEHYKVEILNGIPDDRVSIYRQGDWMDLCRGPHVPATGYIRAFKLTSVAGAYWRGDEHNAMLSRIYGTSFASKEALEEHLKLLELARSRDHRKLGREMGLFVFDPISPGSPFFLPKGAIIYNALVDYMRRLYRRYGFDEVITPQVFKNELWHTSGHWDNFRENMFLTTDREGAEADQIDSSPEGWRKGYAFKPMNCPGHTFIYRAEKRSYRDLPLRIADFGRLHRAERSGTLHGLTRVRTMAQDDAHIFCTSAQIAGEIDLNLQMVRDIYQALGFERLESKVATMPDKHLGTEELWRTSEAILCEALTRNGLAYEINPGEGAFYGPEDRNLRARRAQAALAARDHPARLQHARELRPDVHQRGQRRGAPGDDPSRDPGLARALHRRAARAYGRSAAVLARARAGARAFAERKGRGLCGRDRRHPQARGPARGRRPAQREARLQGARGRTGQGAVHDRRGRARGGRAQRVAAAFARGQERGHGA